MKNLLYKTESYNIIGACMEVHKQLGHGFLETIYQEALELEFTQRNIPYVREERIEVYYKEHTLKQFYIADFICHGNIIVELKALTALETSHTSQVINYLKSTDLQLGLLVNFGERSLQYKRLALSQ